MRWHDQETYTVPNGWCGGHGSPGEEANPKSIRKWVEFAQALADKAGGEVKASWDHCWETLRAFDGQPGREVAVFTDFAPLSFNWSWYEPGKTVPCDTCHKGKAYCPECNGTAFVTHQPKRLMSGGMVFHGSHDGMGNGSFPTLSVSVGQTQPGWSIHS